MPFGQLVIGPPGSGKTTYCNGVQQYMELTGRKVAIVNLDPANDAVPYAAAVDVSELVDLESVQEQMQLGPNGGLVYCIDFLLKNIDWLGTKLKPLEKEDCYFLFDCPGQVELFTLHESLRGIVRHLTGKSHYRLAAVHLVDAHLCSDPHKYISAVLLSLSAMLHLELPHVNVLSKMDLIKQYGDLAFQLDYYLEAQDLSMVLQTMTGNAAFSERFKSLSSAISEVVDEFGLVGFTPLAIEDKESVSNLINIVDKANGFLYSGTMGRSPYPAELKLGAQTLASGQDLRRAHQEKYVEGDVEERHTREDEI
ncbi:unnamed protein product [Ostreobium quekettii]|uniref:GPN-loop GTPase 2 n=1 Tax=Ostreobium quekettii TaxID=121088 RepID=A0A8S1ILH9_9CHLO|nr:unnamed protein product [Ostreobium quekettii]